MSKLSEATGIDIGLQTGAPFLPTWTIPGLDGGDLGDMFGSGDITSEAGQQSADIARQMYSETAPLREDIIGRSERFLGGGFDPTESAMYAPSRRALETQFQQANELARQGLPTGGSLNEALAENIRARAGGLSDIESAITQDEYNRAYGLATGTPALAMSTLSNLAGSEMQAAAMQQAGKNQMFGGFGAGLGSFLGGK